MFYRMTKAEQRDFAEIMDRHLAEFRRERFRRVEAYLKQLNELPKRFGRSRLVVKAPDLCKRDANS